MAQEGAGVVCLRKAPQSSPCVYFCCSVAMSYPTLCDLMDCSRPGFSDLHCLLEFLKFVSTELIPSNHLILCCPFLLLPSVFPRSGSFPMSQLVKLGGQSIGASASVLPMNIQDWFPLGMTGWISLQSKGLSRVFSNTQFKSINSLALSFLHSPTLTSIHDHWRSHSLD